LLEIFDEKDVHMDWKDIGVPGNLLLSENHHFILIFKPKEIGRTQGHDIPRYTNIQYPFVPVNPPHIYLTRTTPLDAT